VETVSLYDVASGLIEPDGGEVRFLGNEWRRMGLFTQSAMRGRIGRMFEVEGWVSNLDMFENIALAERHHTSRPDRDLRAEVRELLDRVGMRDCLADRPHMLSPSQRRRAQWVRAFLGTPDLLLLNAPLVDVQLADHPPIFDLIEAARARGAGVIWRSRDPRGWKGRSGFEQVCCREMKGGRLQGASSGETGGLR
jgi:phospholipid/cholesterol/gamma-HCH transport system ATP-binding protein